ncbi:MAG: ABC transporter permease [Actinobacteria bacterium 13_2_20CM_2_71_6]|nr:MAG: ABC transporter permease [Actinobacteria bacterium 13_2_20CM_2_71_6]
MNLTIAWITARALLGRRRVLLLLPFPVLVVGLTLIAHAIKPDAASDWAEPIIDHLGFGVMVPVIALIVGTAVLGAEIEDGTIVHILAKPLPRREIILAKLAVAAAIIATVAAVPMFVAGTVASSVRFGFALAAGCAVAALGYSAVFLVLSLLTRRPVLIGLVYVLLWEGLLGNLLASTRELSIRQYAATVADRIAPSDLLQTHVGLPVAIVMSAVFLVGGTLVAIDRLRSFTLTGETS